MIFRFHEQLSVVIRIDTTFNFKVDAEDVFHRAVLREARGSILSDDEFESVDHVLSVRNLFLTRLANRERPIPLVKQNSVLPSFLALPTADDLYFFLNRLRRVDVNHTSHPVLSFGLLPTGRSSSVNNSDRTFDATSSGIPTPASTPMNVEFFGKFL